MAQVVPRLSRLAARPFARRAQRSDKPVGLVLMHHEIAPVQGDAEKELLPALGADLFRAQLEHLARHYEVVPLQDLSARMQERSSGERLPVAITFDDDFARHPSVAAPILEEFGFHATFFLTGSSLDGPSTFWWQDIQTILNRGTAAWEEARRELAATWPWVGLDSRGEDLSLTIETLPPGERDAVAAQIHELAGAEPLDEGLRADGIKELVDKGFGIGFHTRRHYCMPTLAGDDLHRAMREGVDELEAVTGYRPTAIAYPHAKADLRVAEAAERAGFELGLVCRHAAVTPEQHPLLLDRVNAWTSSLGSFALALGRLSTAA